MDMDVPHVIELLTKPSTNLVATQSNLQLEMWWCHAMLVNEVHSLMGYICKQPLIIMVSVYYNYIILEWLLYYVDTWLTFVSKMSFLTCSCWFWWFIFVNNIFQLGLLFSIIIIVEEELKMQLQKGGGSS